MPTVKQYTDALTESKGMVATAARALGVTRRAVYDAIEKYPKVAEAREEAKEYAVDVGQNQLYIAAQRGDAWAVCFLLKTLGKSRGFVEKQEHDVTARVETIVDLMRLAQE